MAHYFDSKPEKKDVRRTLEFKINGKSIALESSSNVFSKNGVDLGSEVLLQTLLAKTITGKGLDVGCGYGVIAITLLLLDKNISHMTCLDVNSRAIELTKLNCSNHKLEPRMTILQGDAFKKIEGKFDFIVSNPPIRVGKKLLYGMYQSLKSNLNEGGSIYLVIKKSLGAESHLKYLSSIYDSASVISKKKGYYIIEVK